MKIRHCFMVILTVYLLCCLVLSVMASGTGTGYELATMHAWPFVVVEVLTCTPDIVIDDMAAGLDNRGEPIGGYSLEDLHQRKLTCIVICPWSVYRLDFDW